jgi:hypothetical protein
MTMKQVLYATAMSLTMIYGLAGCSGSNDPAQRPVGITNPPPQRNYPASADFGPPPGDLVQSPGSYIPSPGGPLPPGY